MTTLAQLILEGDNASLIDQLLSDGADPEEIAGDGSPILSLATVVGAIGVVRSLLKAGANVDAVDADGDTALHRAASVSNLEAIRILMDAGAPTDAANRDGKTPLMVAAVMGNLDACRVLILAGADLHGTDSLGRGLLHWAVLRNDDPELVGLLLENGADPSLPDTSGALPADLARLVAHYRALAALLGQTP